MADSTNLRIEFEIVAKPDISLDVQGFEGTEQISKPFSFLVYAATSNKSDTDTLVGERAKLTVTTACGTLVASGIVFQIEEMDPTPQDMRVLKFCLNPRFSVTQLGVENRIYGPGQPVGVDDVIRQEIGRSQINIPVEYMLDPYPKRNYIVQYDESDFTFISRLCEHYGIFYYFKQENSGETVVFGDKNIAFPKVSFGSKTSIYYSHPRDQNVGRKADESAVLSFRQSRNFSSKKIKLRDYNDTIPSIVTGEGDAGQSTAFHGTVVSFGEHFADDSGGADLAKVTAERVAAGHTIYFGETDAPQLRAGTIFTLDGHPTMNAEYLVVATSHSAYRPAPIGFNALPQAGRAYRNTIQCIRSNLSYRPSIVTKKPIAVGLHTAKIDGEAWNGRAEIDNQGRYKLQLMFADEAAARGRGSDFVRKVEPYVGPNQTGLHFPLVAGTEVIIGYINGDIDRPIVLGAVTNPSMQNLVTSASNTYNRIKSQSGSLFEIYDGLP
jgi:type VI secretion system secreted protein VgrG